MGCENYNCNQSNIASPSILWTTYLLLSSHLMNKFPLPNEVLHSLFHFRLLHYLFHFTSFSIFLPSSIECYVLQNFKLIIVYSFLFWFSRSLSIYWTILQILDVLQIVIVIQMRGQVLFYGLIQETCFWLQQKLSIKKYLKNQRRSVWKINGDRFVNMKKELSILLAREYIWYSV